MPGLRAFSLRGVVQGRSGSVLGAVSKPRRLDGLAAAGQLGRPRDTGQAHRIGRNLADAQVSAWSGRVRLAVAGCTESIIFV